MKQLLASVVAALLVQSCTGGAQLYPDTDVVEPVGFDQKVAIGVHKSGGFMMAGNLEYAGSGDLVQVYRDYMAAMRSHGWISAADDIQGQKATGTLRKDNRTCALEFTSNGGQVRVLIKVEQTK